MEHIKSTIKQGWNLFFPKNIDETNKIVQSNNIDLFLIDFGNEAYKTYFKKILKENPKEKIITISENLTISDDISCFNCINNHNKRRLLKPYDIKELYETIDQFNSIQCKYYNGFDDKTKLLPKIIKNYSSCSFNEETKSILCNTSNVKEFMEVKTLLEENNIPFKQDGISLVLT